MPAYTQEEWLRFPESIGPISPSNIGFSMEGGKATMEFLVGTVNAWKVLSEIIGGAFENRPGGFDPNRADNVVLPGIRRVLPLAHPQFPWLYAGAIESYKGHRYIKSLDYLLPYKIPNPLAKLAAPSYPVFADYEEYRVQAGFEPRNYKILPDSYMENKKKTVLYFPPKKNNAVPAVPPVPAVGIAFPGVWPEWERFCYTVVLPRAEYLAGDQGMYTYYIPSNANKVPPQPTLVNVNKGQVKILIPSKSIVVKWHCVPYSYVTGSNTVGNRTVFDLSIGSVNQNRMFSKDTVFLGGYAPGTLLLEGVNVTKIYPKPFPKIEPLPDIGANGFQQFDNMFAFDQELLCDIDIVFAHRNPLTTEAYVSVGNNVYAGHNLLPYLQGNTWYAGIVRAANAAGGGVDDEKTMPLIYPSFPMELLFCNPAWVFDIMDKN